MLRKCRRLIIEENFRLSTRPPDVDPAGWIDVLLASSSDARVTQVARNIATIDVADNITVAIARRW